MIIRPCNLSCQGCTTFSDLTWQGYTTWAEGREQILPWLSRLQFESWGVMGGEPLMNPELSLWLTGIRELMPNTQIRFVTNGLLLHKNRWLVDLLHELGNSVLKISYHISDALLDQEIEFITTRFSWTPVYEFGIHRYVTDNNFRFQIAKPTKFLKTFKGSYGSMSPHNSAPRDAFDICVQKRCPLMYKGKIYKCGTIGLTPDLLSRFGALTDELWRPYITDGLLPTCSDFELENFISNFGKPHKLCSQCPSAQDLESIIDHTITVSRK